MELNAFKDLMFKKAAEYGFTDYELYYSSGRMFNVKIFKGDIDKYENAASMGVSFRGTYKGKMGYAFTEAIDEGVIDALIRNAAQNAEILEEPEAERLYTGGGEYPVVCSYNEEMNGFSVSDKIELAKTMERTALAEDARIKSVDHCSFGTEEGEVRIMNSYGLDLHHKSNGAGAYVSARAVEGDRTKVAFNYWVGRDIKLFSPEDVAKEAVKKSIAYLNAKSTASGVYDVVFENRAACDLMSVFVGVFFAEKVQKGFSLLKDARGIGKQIASPVVTIRDDGVCERSFGSVPFDSEGVPTQNKAVIENGVLKTYLYNLKSAAKDGVASTGNGFKPGFRASVGTSCTNFYMLPGGVTFDGLLAQTGEGLLIAELQGLHAGANAISGDFSLSATGFLIKDGKKYAPVEQITVAGNFFDMLNNVTAIADDLFFDAPLAAGSIGMPSFCVKGMNIAGENSSGQSNG